MSDREPVSTPAIPKKKQSQSDNPIESIDNSLEFCEQKQYQSLVRNLMYSSVVSRSAICFAVYILAQFVSSLSKAHWCAMKHHLRFSSAPSLYLFCLTALKISNVLVFRIPIGQPAKMIASQLRIFALHLVVLVVLSLGHPESKYSFKAEYFSLALAAQEAVYLQSLLTFFCLMTVDTPVLLRGDNQRALALTSNPVTHKLAKRIETQHHFISQLVEDKRI